MLFLHKAALPHMQNRFSISSIQLVALAMATGLFRAFNHDAGPVQILPMLSPMLAILVFANANFTRLQAALLGLAALLVSDLLMMKLYYSQYASGFLYEGWYLNYALLLLFGLSGGLLRTKMSVPRIGGVLVSSAFGYWLLSNLITFFSGTDMTSGKPFELSVAGLAKCYTLALPFLSHYVAGALLYGTLLFGASYQMVKKNAWQVVR